MSSVGHSSGRLTQYRLLELEQASLTPDFQEVVIADEFPGSPFIPPEELVQFVQLFVAEPPLPLDPVHVATVIVSPYSLRFSGLRIGTITINFVSVSATRVRV